MTKEEINAIKQLTIEQAKETFEQDYGYLDKEDMDYVNEKVKLDSYCEGVEDVLKILDKLRGEYNDQTTVSQRVRYVTRQY